MLLYPNEDMDRSLHPISNKTLVDYIAGHTATEDEDVGLQFDETSLSQILQPSMMRMILQISRAGFHSWLAGRTHSSATFRQIAQQSHDIGGLLTIIEVLFFMIEGLLIGPTNRSPYGIGPNSQQNMINNCLLCYYEHGVRVMVMSIQCSTLGVTIQ